MDRRERYFDFAETLRAAMDNHQQRVWTALPCVVQNYPAASGLGKMLLDAQPVVNGVLTTETGSQSYPLPTLTDCPIMWQGGGSMTATFPIKAGDECLIIIASRCIDAWWQQGFKPGAAMDPLDLRMHNLSDGFALVGLRSLPREITPDMNAAALVSDDGQTFFKMNPTAKTLSIQAKGGITMNGVTIDQNGNVSTPQTIHADGNMSSNATISAVTDVKAATVSLKTHTHSAVQAGSGTSGPPVP